MVFVKFISFLEMFRGMMHQDAHEFLNFLLNDISDTLEALNKEKEKENGNRKIINLIFVFVC